MQACNKIWYLAFSQGYVPFRASDWLHTLKIISLSNCGWLLSMTRTHWNGEFLNSFFTTKERLEVNVPSTQLDVNDISVQKFSNGALPALGWTSTISWSWYGMCHSNVLIAIFLVIVPSLLQRWATVFTVQSRETTESGETGLGYWIIGPALTP